MAEELINSYIDRAAIEKETQFLVGKLEEVHSVFTKIKGLKIELQGANSFVQIADSISKVKKEETEFIKIQAQVEKSYQKRLKATDELQKAELAIINTYEKRQVATSQIAKDLAEEKLLLAETTKQLKDQAKEALGLTTAYDKLQAEFAAASKEAKSLGASLGTNSAEYKQAAASASILNDKLKAIDGGIGNFQRNVGNYAGSLSPALESVKKELIGIQNQLKQTGLSANEVEKLNQKAALLEKVLAGVDVAAKTTKQELRNFTEAAKQIGLEFGISSREFQTFIKEVGSKKDELGDIQAAINFQASDTKYIDGVVEAVGGLAGAYGAAEGAAVIFGDAGKDVQEAMAKLQASIAIVTGLQQVLKTIQLEGAAAQTFLAAKTTLLNAAENVSGVTKARLAAASQAAAIAQAEEALAAEAASVALSQQAVAGEAASVANVEVAGTAAGASVALGAEAGAAAVAETASISFATAFAATGIGAIIIALAAAVALVVIKMNEYQAASASIETANKELEKGLESLISAVKTYDDLRTASAKREIDDLATLNEQRKAAGVTAAQGLALDLMVDKKRAELANKEVARAGVTKDKLDAAEKKAKESADYVVFLEQQKQKLLDETSKNGDKDFDKKLKASDALIEKKKAEAATDKSLFDYGNNIYKESVDAENKIAANQIQTSKLNADEQRKLTLETTKLEASLIQDKNSRILSSEKSTQEQRLAAIKSNAQQARVIAEAENNAIQNDPTQSNQTKLIAAKNLGVTLTKLSRDEREQSSKVNEDYRKRELAAQQAFQKIVADEIIKDSEKRFNNENLSYDLRIAAFAKFQDTKKAQIDAEFEYQKELNKTNGSTKLEQEVLEADHQAKLTALIAEGTAKQIDIQLSSYEVVTKKLEEQYGKIQAATESHNARILANNATAYAAQVTSLNNQLQTGTIGLTKYNNERKKLDDNANKQSLIDTGKYLQEQSDNLKKQNADSLNDRQKYIDEYNKLYIKPAKTIEDIDELATLKTKIDSYKDYGKQISDIDKQIADNRAKMSDDNVYLQKKALEDIKKNYEEAKNVIVDLFKQIVEQGFAQQIQAVDDSIAAVDKKKAKDIEVADQTITNEQDKAARIKIIEAKAAAEKDQLEQKKRKIQMEQARFEKAFNIAQIIFNTTSAIISTLNTYKGTPYGFAVATSIGLLGAAQLAKAIATPLPKYAKGTNSHIGGLAMVGDGGKQEVVIEPSGKTYLTPATPTIMDLPMGTKVLPSVEDMTRVAMLAAAPRLKNIDGELMNNYELIGEMKKLNNRIGSVEKAIVNKKENHYQVTRWGLINMQEADNNQLIYLNQNTQF